jgi:hypothetical protein
MSTTMTRVQLFSYTIGYCLLQQLSVEAFSASSSFVGGTCRSTRSLFSSTTGSNRALHQQQSTCGGGNLVMYGDGPNSQELNAWSVIATTERWISDTLKSSNQLASSSAAPSSPSLSVGGNNPYARKEVSYYCETSRESSMIVAGIFRMLKEARERGEQHGIEEEIRADTVGRFMDFAFIVGVFWIYFLTRLFIGDLFTNSRYFSLFLYRRKRLFTKNYASNASNCCSR